MTVDSLLFSIVWFGLCLAQQDILLLTILSVRSVAFGSRPCADIVYKLLYTHKDHFEERSTVHGSENGLI